LAVLVALHILVFGWGMVRLKRTGLKRRNRRKRQAFAAEDIGQLKEKKKDMKKDKGKVFAAAVLVHSLAGGRKKRRRRRKKEALVCAALAWQENKKVDEGRVAGRKWGKQKALLRRMNWKEIPAGSCSLGGQQKQGKGRKRTYVRFPGCPWEAAGWLGRWGQWDRERKRKEGEAVGRREKERQRQRQKGRERRKWIGELVGTKMKMKMKLKMKMKMKVEEGGRAWKGEEGAWEA